MAAERGCAPGHVIAVGSRRGAWRIIASLEQLEKIQDKVEVPQVQFLARVVGVPVVLQRQVPRERVQGCIVEETDVPVADWRRKLSKS